MHAVTAFRLVARHVSARLHAQHDELSFSPLLSVCGDAFISSPAPFEVLLRALRFQEYFEPVA